MKVSNKTKQEKYRRRVRGIIERIEFVIDSGRPPGGLPASFAREFEDGFLSLISEVLDEVELVVVGYIGDDVERKCARNRLAEIKKGLKEEK